jgi:transcriptional regulator with XRE-family HTH domain
MSQLLADRLRLWRGKRYIKEAADILGIPIGTYRKYEEGKRTPNKLALAELERRLEETQNARTEPKTGG